MRLRVARMCERTFVDLMASRTIILLPLLLVLVHFPLSNQVECELYANGACCENRCFCQAGYYGQHCEMFNSCYQIKCKNGGICENSTATCKCVNGFIGSTCSIIDCGRNGIYDPNTGRCKCRQGFTGKHCEHCAKSKMAGRTHVCCPTNMIEYPYTLLAISDDMIYKFLSGFNGGRPCTLQNATLLDGSLLDCSCMPLSSVETTKQKKTATDDDDVAFVIEEAIRFVSNQFDPSLLAEIVDNVNSLTVINSPSTVDDIPSDDASTASVIVLCLVISISAFSLFVVSVWALWKNSRSNVKS